MRRFGVLLGKGLFFVSYVLVIKETADLPYTNSLNLFLSADLSKIEDSA